MNFITGEIYLYTNLPRPKSKYDRIKSWPLEKKSDWSWPGALIGGVLGGPLGFIVGGYLNADGSVKAEAHPIIDDYIYVDANFASVPPAQCIRVRKFDANFFEAGGFDKAQWEAYASTARQKRLRHAQLLFQRPADLRMGQHLLQRHRAAAVRTDLQQHQPRRLLGPRFLFGGEIQGQLRDR